MPLSASGALRPGAEELQSKKLGTGFGGKSEVGVRVEELLAREGKL